MLLTHYELQLEVINSWLAQMESRNFIAWAESNLFWWHGVVAGAMAYY